MFGRATIRLGICPHSSVFCYTNAAFGCKMSINLFFIRIIVWHTSAAQILAILKDMLTLKKFYKNLLRGIILLVSGTGSKRTVFEEL